MSDDVVDESPLIDVEQPELYDVERSWEEDWRGMPDYEHQRLEPHSTMLVHFRNERDRLAFSKLVGQNYSARTKFIWYPKLEIRTAADKVYKTDKVYAPRYPIYIISKGRCDSRLTSRALEWIKVPYHIVVEPQE